MSFHFAAKTTILSLPNRVIGDDYVINKQDLAKDELFHINEACKLINSREHI